MKIFAITIMNTYILDKKKLPEDFVVINQSDEGFKESTEKEIGLLKRNNKNNKSLSAEQYSFFKSHFLPFKLFSRLPPWGGSKSLAVNKF